MGAQPSRHLGTLARRRPSATCPAPPGCPLASLREEPFRRHHRLSGYMRYVLALPLALMLAGCGGTNWSAAWRDAAGNKVDEHVVSTGRPECLESVVVLYLGWPLGTRTSYKSDAGREYARNRGGYADTVMPFRENVGLPAGARDTGYRLGDIELWIWGDARQSVFLVDGDDVELWPRLEDQIGCA